MAKVLICQMQGQTTNVRATITDVITTQGKITNISYILVHIRICLFLSKVNIFIDAAQIIFPKIIKVIKNTMSHIFMGVARLIRQSNVNKSVYVTHVVF
jgi:hypothetical protein